MRKIAAIFSDMHSGYQLGLCAPATELEFDGQMRRVHLNEVQEWLWGIYARGISKAVEMAGEDEILPVHNGDPTHGDRFMEELVTTRLADQLTIARMNLGVWFALPQVKQMELCLGTGVHEFGEGSASVLLADMLREAWPDRTIGSAYHYLLNVAGVSIDLAHHGPHPGSRSWLRGNIARFYLRDVMIQNLMAMKKPPDLVIRSHFHTYINEVVCENGSESRLVITPALCIPGGHARKATRSISEVTCGMVLVECVDGRVGMVEPVLDKIDLRKYVEV